LITKTWWGASPPASGERASQWQAGLGAGGLQPVRVWLLCGSQAGLVLAALLAAAHLAQLAPTLTRPVASPGFAGIRRLHLTAMGWALTTFCQWRTRS
jgi:hypothetical protein